MVLKLSKLTALHAVLLSLVFGDWMACVRIFEMYLV